MTICKQGNRQHAHSTLQLYGRCSIGGPVKWLANDECGRQQYIAVTSATLLTLSASAGCPHMLQAMMAVLKVRTSGSRPCRHTASWEGMSASHHMHAVHMTMHLDRHASGSYATNI